MAVSTRIISELEKNMNRIWKERDKQQRKSEATFNKMYCACSGPRKEMLRKQYQAERSELQRLNNSLDAAADVYIDACKLDRDEPRFLPVVR